MDVVVLLPHVGDGEGGPPGDGVVAVALVHVDIFIFHPVQGDVLADPGALSLQAVLRVQGQLLGKCGGAQAQTQGPGQSDAQDSALLHVD